VLSPHRRDRLTLALEVKRASGRAGFASSERCISGAGWSLLDVVCCAGPGDLAFEERHSHCSVSFVAAGSFSYRSATGSALLAPGAVLLGNAGACFECGHEHAEGDRCVSFHFDACLMEEVARDIGCRSHAFSRPSLPPLRALSRLYARSCIALDGNVASVEALAFEVATAALDITSDGPQRLRSSTRDLRRVVEAVRYLEMHHADSISVCDLAATVNLTRAHFLRLFKSVAGTTPHQFVLRLRLRAAAGHLLYDDDMVTVIAYAVGFQDLSHFTRSFAAEFGCSPSEYRRSGGALHTRV
jgi:AraC family transcriptional regulator